MILDFLFPKRCVICRKFGEYLCPDCFAKISFDVRMICLVCGRASIDSLTHPRCIGKYRIDGCFAAVAYTGIIKKLLYTYKYKPYLSDVKSVIADLFYESSIQNEALYRQLSGALLAPIPLHPTRLKKRGYDQVYLLARDFGKKTNLPVMRLLKRSKDTKSQYGLKREERRENLKNAFTVFPQEMEKGQTIVLIDDIVTSGATLLEAARVLKRGGYKKVYGLAFAHGQ